MKRFAKVINPCPVLNRYDFKNVFGGPDGKSLLTCEKKHIRALEFIAFKDMVFEIIKRFPQKDYDIYQVTSELYPVRPIFIDSRFTTLVDHDIPYKIEKPDPKILLNRLEALIGTPYVWGGNWSKGIIDMLSLYEAPANLNNLTKTLWTMRGVDCSGYLFEATNCYTPRNTTELFNFGKGLTIENKKTNELIKIIKPLDLIVYKGHVVIIFDKKYTIESREFYGVVKTPVLIRLEELYQTKTPSDAFKSGNHFVIRRWTG